MNRQVPVMRVRTASDAPLDIRIKFESLLNLWFKIPLLREEAEKERQRKFEEAIEKLERKLVTNAEQMRTSLELSVVDGIASDLQAFEDLEKKNKDYAEILDKIDAFTSERMEELMRTNPTEVLPVMQENQELISKDVASKQKELEEVQKKEGWLREQIAELKYKGSQPQAPATEVGSEPAQEPPKPSPPKGRASDSRGGKE